jgi:hypothetical protein
VILSTTAFLNPAPLSASRLPPEAHSRFVARKVIEGQKDGRERRSDNATEYQFDVRGIRRKLPHKNVEFPVCNGILDPKYLVCPHGDEYKTCGDDRVEMCVLMAEEN